MGRAERSKQARQPVRPAVRTRAAAVVQAHALGVAAVSEGRIKDARKHFRDCLAIDHTDAEAGHDLGVVLLRLGEVRGALDQLRAVASRHRSHVGAWLNLSLALCEAGDAPGAISAASRAVTLLPRSSATQAALGHALTLGGDLHGAEAAYRRSVASGASTDAVVARHASTLGRLGRLGESLQLWEGMASRHPTDLRAQAEGFLLLRALGRPEADARGRLVAGLATSDREGLRVLCGALAEGGRRDDALALADLAVEAAPAVADLRTVRASLRHGSGRSADALEDLRAALDLDPTDVDVLFGIGRLFQIHGQPAAAGPFLAQALALRPDSVDACVHLAEVRAAEGDVAQGTSLLRRAMSMAPDRLWLTADLCWNRLMACDWRGLEDEWRRSLALHLAEGVPFPPFTLMAFGLPGAELLMWTRAWAEGKIGPAQGLRPAGRRATGRAGRGRIRLGYLSADFKDHATILLMAELFEGHDRDRFEVHGYSLGPIDDSDRCRRALRSLDAFVDLSSLDDAGAAARIASDGVDVLLDLKGYTKDGRPGILAHRPAPVQVSYLGYPGSMGTPAIDYLIADAVVAPEEHWSLYDEAVVHLPHSYQPNDRRRAGADPRARREDHGLPTSGFVFCCFNTNYKITPLLFDVWMRLLAAVPGSVLWLMSVNNQVQDNLRREAGARGVDPQRLVFAPRLAFEGHVGRMGLADLFLDTLPVCAHTTASEALWAGLPVLTCLGPHFVGRVAGSLLAAVGLPELVTSSLTDYEREALTLARDPARLRALRDRLSRDRLASPLFDTPRYLANFEAALETMVRRASEGLPPAPFAVREPARPDAAEPSVDGPPPSDQPGTPRP